MNAILTDIMDFLTALVKSVFRNNEKKAEAQNRLNDVEFRISVRRVAFSNLLISLGFIPLSIFDTKIFYPFLSNWWDWDYWRFIVLISIVLYLGAVILTPRIHRAKYVYILRIIYFIPFYGFFIIFGQVLAFQTLPNNYLIWYGVLMLPVLIYAPYLYNKTHTFLRTVIESTTIKWKLRKDSTWIHEEYLPIEVQNSLSGLKGCVFPIVLSIFFFFLINIHSIFKYDLGNLIRLGVINASFLYFFVEASYRSVVIYILLSELEYEISHPLMFKDFDLVEKKRAFYPREHQPD